MLQNQSMRRTAAPHGYRDVAPQTEGPDPTVTIGSGVPLPTGNLTGWAHAWGNDFLTNCLEGQFATYYSNPYDAPTARTAGQLRTYPSSYKDTRTRDHPERNSWYDPGILSVNESVLRKRIHTDGSGKIHVAAVGPKLAPASTYNVLGGRFEACWRVPAALPGFKVAWLLWPQSNHATTSTGVGADGEIDSPEFNLTAGSTVGAFVHDQGGVSGVRPQSTRGSSVVGVGTSWHRTVIEWKPGTLNSDGIGSTGGFVRFFTDGVQHGTDVTRNVPATPMHWILQSESILGAGDTVAYGPRGVDPAVAGVVEIDWLSYWSVA